MTDDENRKLKLVTRDAIHSFFDAHSPDTQLSCSYFDSGVVMTMYCDTLVLHRSMDYRLSNERITKTLDEMLTFFNQRLESLKQNPSKWVTYEHMPHVELANEK